VETLRVAIISSAVLPTPPYGYGTEIATYWLARELARMGHQVTLYAALRESRLHCEAHPLHLRPSHIRLRGQGA